jgi:glycosyltransferase involved in cell wall biosynthesis
MKIQPGKLKLQNISIVTETYPPEINGVSLTLSNLVNGLRARGHSVSVVRPSQRKSDTAMRGSTDATLVRGLPLPGYRGLQFGVPARRMLQRNWRIDPPDSVYIATEGPLGWSAMRAARSLDIPVISGFHTNYHNYCQHYRIGWLQHLALRYLRWFHNQTSCTLVSNEDLRSRLTKLGFDNVSILDRGVDSQLFTPLRRSIELRRQWGAGESDLVLIYIGRVAAEKNIDLAIAAYRAARLHRSKIKFVIVGDGPLRHVLVRANHDLMFVGSKTGEELAQYYASADVFLFASETETFGNVTLEAMASGLAVVAYDYAGAKVHITDGSSGVLVPYGDGAAFIEGVCRLVQEPSALCRMRRQARQHAVKVAWPRVVEQFESLLMGARMKHCAGDDALSKRRPSSLWGAGERGDADTLGIR